MIAIIVSLIICTTALIIMYMIRDIFKIRNEIIVATVAKLISSLDDYVKTHHELLKCVASNNGSGQFRNNSESSQRFAEEKSTDKQVGQTLDIGAQPEDYLPRISKGTQTAVSFGEDVSE